MNPPQAARAIAPPTLIRRTPSAAMSATVILIAAQKIDRPGGNSRHHRSNLLAGAQARRVEAIGTGLRIGLESRDRFMEVGATDRKAFSPPDQHDVAAHFVDGAARRAHPLACFVECIQRLCHVPSRVFYRQPGHAGLDGKANALGNTGGIGREPTLEVGVHRNIGRRDDFMKMRKCHVARDAVVGVAARPGEP